MRVTLGIPLAASTASSFAPVLLRLAILHSSLPQSGGEIALIFYLRKLLIISRNLRSGIEI